MFEGDCMPCCNRTNANVDKNIEPKPAQKPKENNKFTWCGKSKTLETQIPDNMETIDPIISIPDTSINLNASSPVARLSIGSKSSNSSSSSSSSSTSEISVKKANFAKEKKNVQFNLMGCVQPKTDGK
jgi:hypothetical protein